MKQFFTVLLFLACTSTTAFAQLTESDKLQASLTIDNKDTVAWLRTGIVQFGLNQGFLHNWPAGGEVAALTVAGLVSANITRLNHRKVWSNTLEASYSLFYGQSNNFVPRKIDDRIDFTSKYGTPIDTEKNFYFTGLFNFKSQFTHGYDYAIPEWETQPTSTFLSPAYFTLAAGLEYLRGRKVSLFFSPAALRFTIARTEYTTRRPEGAFGISYGETSRFELGAYFSGRFQHNITKDILYKTRLDMYLNYLAKDKKDSLGVVVKKDNPGNVDIFWDNMLTMKLGKYFNLNFALTAIYDNDIPYQDQYVEKSTGLLKTKDEPGTGLGWWQIKEVMTFGIVYRIH